VRSRYVYKICEQREWESHEVLGGSADDRRDGFLHFSTAEQLPATFAKHFAGKRDLVLLRAETRELGDRLRWEPSRGGELFPHFYGELSFGDVWCVGHMPEGPDGCSFLPDVWRRDGEIESRVETPKDWMDARGWDEFWTAVLLDRFWTQAYTRGFDFDMTCRPYMATIEPRRQHAIKEHRPGGRVTIVNEDLFAYEPEQPFHAIFSQRAYQGFPPERREELARRFCRWLHPGGLLLWVWLLSTAKIAGKFREVDGGEGAKEDTPWFVREYPPIRT